MDKSSVHLIFGALSVALFAIGAALSPPNDPSRLRIVSAGLFFLSLAVMF
jgi:hypothetical protein